MAKKTKKEKIIAQLRRQVALNQSHSSVPPQLTHDPIDTTLSFAFPSKKIVSQSSTQTTTITAPFLYQDLSKTALVALVLFAIQFFLYWVFERGGDRLLAPLVGKFLK